MLDQKETNNIVYALIDPRDRRAYYIGMSGRGIERIKCHARSSVLAFDEAGANPAKATWIKSLPERDGLPYDYEILESFATAREAEDAEEGWIQKVRALGEPLLNRAPGGRSATRGRKRTEEERARMSDSWTPERKQKASESMRGNTFGAGKRPDEFGAAISARLQGHAVSDETSKHLKAAWTPEMRQQEKERNQTYWTPERRAQHCSERKGAKRSPEVGEKVSSAKSTTGFKDVSWSKTRNRYLVNVRTDGVNKFGGSYTRIEDAVAARDALKQAA